MMVSIDVLYIFYSIYRWWRWKRSYYHFLPYNRDKYADDNKNITGSSSSYPRQKHQILSIITHIDSLDDDHDVDDDKDDR